VARLIEISGPITHGMWDYNSLDLGGATLPAVSVTRRASIPEYGFDAHEITVSTLTATYTETAAHMIEGAPTLDQVAITELIRPARLMRLPAARPRTLITRDQLQANDPGLNDGDALVIDTGWGTCWDTPGYVTDAPAFAVSTLDWFLSQPFSILALDTPVMECLWCSEADMADQQGDLLKPLYEHGMLLIAPVINLDQITQPTGTLVSLPMAVEGVCSAPSRVLYVEGANWADEIESTTSSHRKGV
jgi:kynurenine formamidase